MSEDRVAAESHCRPPTHSWTTDSAEFGSTIPLGKLCECGEKPWNPAPAGSPSTTTGFRVSFPGPFSQHEVVVDGWRVPLIHAHPTGENDESIMLVIDNRLAETFSVEEAERLVPFLADAVAVALGYTCHPRDDEEPVRNPQPRPVRMHGIVGIQAEEVDPNV